MSEEKLSIAQKTRSRILDQAARLFREKGYAAVSLRGIADAADMKAGSVYYHFNSKDDIVLEVLDQGIKKVHLAVEEAFQTGKELKTPEELMKSCIKAHLEALLSHSDYTSANVRIYGQVPDEIQNQALKVRRDYEGLWDQLLKQVAVNNALRPEVNPKLFRLALIGSLNATLEWFDPEQGDIDNLAEGYSQILLNGIMRN
ncbi:TetR/AcrR family transcriptional regulator [Sneathiella limimaris]|uniref:TetR/AcrR family transcriptional regulator n=1 Tax=Sneathiella limimaris TaxID=1964213 RepID=UPI0019D31C82|nr:TetR/AcrR family transcriptional regulator [Sneathiella limimaris]